MRHQYTPVFREFTTSSMWAEPPATRCVWLYLLLHADPEGFVPGTIPGLAIAANVSLKETGAAINKFLKPDPHSNTQKHKGRRLEKVPHGWRILNFEYWRELAKHEAEKARKRRWINAKRRAENDNDGKMTQLTLPHVDMTSTPVDSSELLDAPKPKPKSDLSSSSSSTAREGFDNQPVVHSPVTLHAIPEDLELSDELIADAKMAGVKDPVKWFGKLKRGPIGGERGVFPHMLEAYVRDQFGKWKTWEETERAKDARSSAANAPQRSFGARQPPPVLLEPNAKHEAFAKKHGLDLDAVVQGIIKDDIAGSLGLLRAREMIGERLAVSWRQKKAGEKVTGKLTEKQALEWGTPPIGGGLPEVA